MNDVIPILITAAFILGIPTFVGGGIIYAISHIECKSVAGKTVSAVITAMIVIVLLIYLLCTGLFIIGEAVR